jgi:hypothetical protein
LEGTAAQKHHDDDDDDDDNGGRSGGGWRAYGNVGFLDGQLVVAATEDCWSDDDEDDGNVDPEETLVLDVSDSPALPAETNQGRNDR